MMDNLGDVEKSLKKNKQAKQTLPHLHNDWKSGKLANKFTHFTTLTTTTIIPKKFSEAPYKTKANVFASNASNEYSSDIF